MLFLFFVSVLSGCAANRRAKQMRQQFQNTIPICYDEMDCRNKWSAAQIWVARNCRMKIQIVTDTIIETYGPPEYSTKLAATVIKEPVGNGRYQIIISTWCDNFQCYPDALQSALHFNQYVGSQSSSY